MLSGYGNGTSDWNVLKWKLVLKRLKPDWVGKIFNIFYKRPGFFEAIKIWLNFLWDIVLLLSSIEF